MPTAAPIPRPAAISPQLPIPSSSSVVTTAKHPGGGDQVAAFGRLGWVPCSTPMMNSEKATM